jgi:hypothetical protein
MALFKDAANRTWIVTISAFDIARVKKLLDINLYRLMDNGFKGLSELLDDPIMLPNVIFVLVSDQAAVQKVSDEDLGRALFGQSYVDAAQAFQDALVDFFQGPQKGAIQTVLRASKVYQQTVQKESEKDLAGLEERMRDQAIKAVAEARAKAQQNGSSTNAPESSVSTPAPSPSVSS